MIPFDIIMPIDHTPNSNRSGVIMSIPGICTVTGDNIRAGKITEIKLINTMLIENRNTIHGIIWGFVYDFVFSTFLSFVTILILNFSCLKFEW